MKRYTCMTLATLLIATPVLAAAPTQEEAPLMSFVTLDKVNQESYKAALNLIPLRFPNIATKIREYNQEFEADRPLISQNIATSPEGRCMLQAGLLDHVKAQQQQLMTDFLPKAIATAWSQRYTPVQLNHYRSVYATPAIQQTLIDRAKAKSESRMVYSQLIASDPEMEKFDDDTMNDMIDMYKAIKHRLANALKASTMNYYQSNKPKIDSCYQLEKRVRQ